MKHLRVSAYLCGIALLVSCGKSPDLTHNATDRPAPRSTASTQEEIKIEPTQVPSSTLKDAPQAKALMDSRWAVQNGGSLSDSPVERANCDALQLFSDNPRNAERQNELVGPQSGATKDVVESRRVGEIQGFPIYSIIDHIEYKEPSARADAPLYIKMIVVERKPGEYCEIYNDLDEVSVMESVEPAFLMDIGSETLLASKDPVSGNGGISKEVYWTFDKDGPIFLNYSGLLDQALQSLLPKGNFVPSESASFDMKSLSFRSGVGKEGDARCCPSNGNVSIQFAIRNHQLAVVSQKYDPPATR